MPLWPGGVGVVQLGVGRLHDHDGAAGGLMGTLPVGDGLRDGVVDVVGVDRERDVRAGGNRAERLGQSGQRQEAQGAVELDMPLSRSLGAERTCVHVCPHDPAHQDADGHDESDAHAFEQVEEHDGHDGHRVDRQIACAPSQFHVGQLDQLNADDDQQTGQSGLGDELHHAAEQRGEQQYPYAVQDR
ncbi:Uncharacterised protein [Mycobacteroides abscessus subsp. massiliense]|nr:Uncharacterised protein [Mycobacteroides abscessus subsp. massiliense]